MKLFLNITFSTLFLFAANAFSQTGNPSGPPTTAQQPVKKNLTQSAKQLDGQQVFAQNCSRCHSAPEGFSSHISGTVVKHMRVRAGLSSEEEKAILRFLNP